MRNSSVSRLEGSTSLQLDRRKRIYKQKLGEEDGKESANKFKTSKANLGSAGKVTLAAIVHSKRVHHQEEKQQFKTTKNSSYSNLFGQAGRARADKDKKKTRDNIIGEEDKRKENKLSRLFSSSSLASSQSGKNESKTNGRLSANNNNKRNTVDSLEVDKQLSEGFEQASYAKSQERHDQVIEFKFDLIVDLTEVQQEQEQEQQLQMDTQGLDLRLKQTINGLVESFSLESEDVCILSIGNSMDSSTCMINVDPSRDEKSTLIHGNDHFSSITRIASYSIAYTFRVLTQECNSNQFSLEIGLNSFLETSSKENGSKYRDITQQHSSNVECHDLDSSLACVNLISKQLSDQIEAIESDDSKIDPKFLFILSIKLKRNINGGIFNNRMSLIYFDPEIHKLHPIFESVFSGKALTYLRTKFDNNNIIKQQHHIQHEQSEYKIILKQNNIHQLATEFPQHVQDSLTQAELVIYKQLSSALIKTLVIVNVHKLQCTNMENGKSYTHKMMQRNLLLLEFAHMIHRASMMRIKRRKRSSKLHLPGNSSNASLTSNKYHCDRRIDYLATPNHSRRARRIARLSRLEASQDQESSIRCQYYHESGTSRLKPSENLKSTSLLRCQRHQSADIFTESSSMSTSSGSQRAPKTATNALTNKSVCWPSTTQRGSLNNNPSDSDSIMSANLESYGSSSSAHITDTKVQLYNRPEYLELTNLSNKTMDLGERISETNLPCIESRNHLKSRGLNESHIIQIDCQDPNNQRTIDAISSNNIDLFQPQQYADNSSDICSITAEPMKQLKLEKFLNQFNGFAGPISLKGQQNANSLEDDDEDCKSHSSILEHLSSLALESSVRRWDPKNLAQPTGFLPSLDLEQPDTLIKRINSVDEPRVALVSSLPVDGVRSNEQNDSITPLESRLMDISISCQVEEKLEPPPKEWLEQFEKAKLDH